MFIACSPDRHGAAHDHVLDQGGVQVVAGQQGGQGLGGQVGGVPSREAAPAAAHRGADGVDDHGVGHKEANSDAESDPVPDGPGVGPDRAARSANMTEPCAGSASTACVLVRCWRPARRGRPGRAGTAAASASPPAPRARRPRPPAPALSAGQQVTVTYCNHEKARITEPAALHGPAPPPSTSTAAPGSRGTTTPAASSSTRIGPALAAQGFVVVSLDYRLGPQRALARPDRRREVRHPLPARQRAPASTSTPTTSAPGARARAGTSSALLGTAGPSAGWDVGAYPDESSKVQAVVDMAGPSDLLDHGGPGRRRAGRRELHLAPRRRAARAARRRPEEGQPDHLRRTRATRPSSSSTRTTTRSSIPEQSQELAWDLGAGRRARTSS